MAKLSLTKAWIMIAEATSMSAVTRCCAAMPASMSDRARRRAPAIEKANAHAETTSAESRTKLPRPGTALLRRSRVGRVRGRARRSAEGRGGGGLCGLVLRRALRHHAVGLYFEARFGQPPLQHHFRSALERIGHDAGVVRGDDMAVGLHLEAIVQRVRTPQDAVVDDVTVQLQVLAVPLVGRRHHFIDVLVVRRGFAETERHQ